MAAEKPQQTTAATSESSTTSRNKDELKRLQTELRRKHPVDKRLLVQLQTEVEKEVLMPCLLDEITREEAERRWVHMFRTAPTIPANPSAGTSPTEHQSAEASTADLAPPEKEETRTVPITDETSKNSEDGEPDPQATTVVEGVEPPPAVRPVAEWKVLEPEDRNDPVEHEICEERDRDANSREQRWTITAASVRGKLHAHKALWRDDAYQFDWVDDWTILAVSDGAGSARISRVGARIACDNCVETIKELLTGLRLNLNEDGLPSENDLKRLRSFLVEAARKAQDGILREAQQRDCSPRDMHATLLLMIHTPLADRELVGAIQIGDGAVGVLTKDGTCTLVGEADHGEFSSETRFLTTPHIEREFEQRVVFSIKEDIQCLAAMCDGVSDDFFPEDKRLVELFVGDPIADLKTKEGDPVRGVMQSIVPRPGDERGSALQAWLRYECKGSSDDRTLLLMHRSDAS